MEIKILKSGSIITKNTPSGPETKTLVIRMPVGIVSTGSTTSQVTFESETWTASNLDFVE